MMIRAARRSRIARMLAACGLWAVLCVIFTAELHHGADDPDCQTAIGGGAGAAIGQDTSLAPQSQAQHCLICHAFQSARAEQPGARVSPAQVASRLPDPAAVLARLRLFAYATPARAPPTA